LFSARGGNLSAIGWLEVGGWGLCSPESLTECLHSIHDCEM
jgi:hypothetical protein